MKPILKLGAIIAISLSFSSCSYGAVNQVTKEKNKSKEQVIQVQTQAPVKIPTTKEIVETLCSDEFEGRLTGSKGNEKSGEYISEIFKSIELSPMSEDSYYKEYSQMLFRKYGLIDKDDEPKNKEVNNVVGVIKGKDSKNAVIISAHFDHIGYQDGKVIRGALDNASGISALIKIASTLKEKSKEKPFNMDVVFCAFNGEEIGLGGSREFVKDIKSREVYHGLYNINIDCIGSKDGGKLALKNKSKVSNKLYEAMKKTLKKDNIEFSDTAVKGISDNLSFEYANISNIFFVQENIERLVHKPTDTPVTLDYKQIDKIADAISDFVETNDGTIFN